MCECENKKKNVTSRKKFIDIILGSSLVMWLGSILYPIGRFLVPPEVTGPDVNSVEAAMANELAPNSHKIFRFGRMPVILIRLSDGGYKALAATCTHLDCTVQYKSDTEQVWCACHNGIYDIEGRNISGPPPKPLEQFEVVESQGKIIVRRGKLA